jgi:hypothetical protein
MCPVIKSFNKKNMRVTVGRTGTPIAAGGGKLASRQWRKWGSE